MQFQLSIVTPERQAYNEEVTMVTLPTANGRIGILANHQRLLSALTEGEVVITKDNREFSIVIGGGFLEITDNKAAILVTRAVHAHELNEREILKAQESVKAILSQKRHGEDMRQAQAVLRRSFLELKILHRHKLHPTPYKPS